MISKETQSKLDAFWKRTEDSEESDENVRLIRELQAHIEKLEKQLGVAKEALEYYASPRRCDKGKNWQVRWDYVEIKHESDYEFYPNHDVAVEALEEMK